MPIFKLRFNGAAVQSTTEFYKGAVTTSVPIGFNGAAVQSTTEFHTWRRSARARRTSFNGAAVQSTTESVL